jgi:hypothetical protein
MTDLLLYDEDDEHEQAPTVYERNPSTLLP